VVSTGDEDTMDASARADAAAENEAVLDEVANAAAEDEVVLDKVADAGGVRGARAVRRRQRGSDRTGTVMRYESFAWSPARGCTIKGT
jgi:hypothetical protein